MTIAPEKTKAPVPGGLVGEPALRHGIPRLTDNPTKRAGRLDRLVITEALLCDPDVRCDAKLVLGAFAAHPNRPPTRDEIKAAVPFVTNDRFASAIRYIAQKGLAFVDRSGNRTGNPLRLTRLAPHVDTRREENDVVHIPTAPLAHFLQRRSASTDAILFGYYHGLQRRRHGVQSSDTATAAALGWANRTVTDSRLRLLSYEALVEIRPARGRDGAAIYAIPEALPGAEAIFDHCDHPGCPKCFHEAWTRSLHHLPVDADTLTVLATADEAALTLSRIENASPSVLQQLCELARNQTKPHPYTKASDLLDAGGLLDDGSPHRSEPGTAESQSSEEPVRTPPEAPDDDIPY